jgi:hypothetical protein
VGKGEGLWVGKGGGGSVKGGKRRGKGYGWEKERVREGEGLMVGKRGRAKDW